MEAHTRPLPPLKVGDTVFVQNQSGNHPRRFERTGVVVEVQQHDQYQVRLDGSGRIYLRNRKFLRKFTPTPRASPASPASPANPPKPVHMVAKPTSPITPPVTPVPPVILTPPAQQADNPAHQQRTPARNQTPEQWAASPTFVPHPAASPSPSPFHGFPSPRRRLSFETGPTVDRQQLTYNLYSPESPTVHQPSPSERVRTRAGREIRPPVRYGDNSLEVIHQPVHDNNQDMLYYSHPQISSSHGWWPYENRT